MAPTIDPHLSPRSRLLFLSIGLGAMAASAAGLALAGLPDHPASTTHTATFQRAGQGLDQRSDVKVRGIKVGRIRAVTLTRDGRATVRFDIDAGIRLPRTTIAGIEPVSVFGPKDLTLDLGAGRGPYLPDGGAVTRTQSPRDLADTATLAYRLSTAINPDDLAALLHTLATGLNGQGPALNRTIDNSAQLIDQADRDRARLQQLLDDLTGLPQTLGDRGPAINTILASGNDLGAVLTAHPDKIGQLLDQTGALADQSGRTLQQHGDNLAAITDTTAQTTAVLNQQRPNIDLLLDGLNGFFNLLAATINSPGPDSTTLALMRNTLPADLCQVFIDLCPLLAPTAATRP
ncbi:MCE family protein [Actinomadura bangladeshensis]|uniref:MCE family protein n=1 Tax=Actinomadura bangladeshensis TaxID=453573 RepID=A0A6L9Q9S6_9ACTN|nr:MCE family protein [Actinomadura bangladeshensis]NEA21965.1 MCE family protein [Actinomadura bangladeshensis]